MINANELRLGNLVMFNDKCDRVSVVTSIQKESLCIEWGYHNETMCTGAVIHPEWVIPIPLTPEILEKIIRPKSDKPITAAFIFPDVCMIATSEDGNILLGFNLLDRLVFVCKYVHQLQNAHFAMTGEELEINLP